MYVIISSATFSQQINIDSSIITGNWSLSKHTITKKGLTVEEPDKNRSSTYDFYKTGKYRLIDQEGNSQFITMGKWKVIDEGKKVHLFNNTDIPDDPQILIGDHDLNIVFVKGVMHLTHSFGDSLFSPETYYYTKKK